MANNLNIWVKYISEQSIPVFNCSIQSVLKLTRDDQSSSKQLADTILRDACLTSRVLKIANSPFYNRQSQQFYDVRRAILLIGFNKIYEICLSLAIIDTLVDKTTHCRVAKLLSKSFHAALQAQSIAELCGISETHDIYIAALLYEFGEIAFWSVSRHAGNSITQSLYKPGIKPEKAQEELMGVTFKQLTLGLTSEWHISNLLKTVLLEAETQNLRVKSVYDGHRLAELIKLEAHDPQRIQVVTQIAKSMAIPKNELQNVVKKNENHAKKIYQYYLNSSTNL